MDQIPDGTFLWKNQNKRVNILHLLSSHYFKTINISANDLHVKCVQVE